MRRIPKLTNPNYTEREFTIKNFIDFTFNAQKISASANGLTQSLVSVSVLPFVNASAIRLYHVKDIFYAYTVSGQFMTYRNDAWESLSTFNYAPLVIPFKKEGQECTLVSGDHSFIIYEDGTVEAITLPSGNLATVYKDMLFIAQDNRLSFSKLYDYQDFTTGIDNSGFITTDKNCGAIIALAPCESSLIIVCERAIYHFTVNGQRGDYKLVKQDVAIEAERGSVRKVGDIIYAFNEGYLCKYQNGNLSKVNCGIIKGKYFFNGQAAVDGNDYYATLIDTNGNKYLFTYNNLTSQTQIIRTNSAPILADGGYFIEDYAVKRLTDNLTEGIDGCWESVWLDFNSPKIKTLSGIAVKCLSPLSLEVESSYGKRNFAFESGYNLIKTNVTDKAFKVKITLPAKNAEVEKIKFIYRFQED